LGDAIGASLIEKGLVTVEFDYDSDTVVFQALRIFRNSFISYCRARLQAVFGSGLDAEIRNLFKKEWEDVARSAQEAYSTGILARSPVDALDHLSVNHTFVLLEKYWTYLAPVDDPQSETAKKVRQQLTSWARELVAVRNPIAHGPSEPLALRDALRYVDSGARILNVLRISEGERLGELWRGLLGSTDVVPPSTLDTLPSREQITTDFVGRESYLTDLWRWLGDDTRRVWALVGDGGKGKTTIAYEFASQSRGHLGDFALQGVLWLSAKRRRYLEGAAVPTASADFADLDTALNWLLVALGWAEEVNDPLDIKQSRCLELLKQFPMLVVADDIDSLEKEDEQAVEFFVQRLPPTGCKVLVTSRRELFGLGSCTTRVDGMTEAEVVEFVSRRLSVIGDDPAKVNSKVMRQIREITDGSPLYIEDFLRLAQFYSLEHALQEWSGRRGDPAREFSLRREMEKLSKGAVAVLGVLAYSDAPVSLQECAAVVGLSDERAETALSELRHWNLLARPGLIEDVPRYTCSRNLGKLLRRTLEGTDEEKRIRNGLRGLAGVVVGSTRVRKYIQQAVALKQRGAQDEAERTLLEGLREVPNSGEIYAMLGWLYSKWQPTPRVVNAEENFQRAEVLGSGGRELYAHWADMEFRRSEYRQAADICERSLKGPAKDDVFTWRLAGIAYTRLGQLLNQSLSTEQGRDAFDRADRALRRAQELSREPGELSRCLNARYRLALSAGSVDSSREVLGEWRTLVPSDPYMPDHVH
jgi:tetratricopeptide (TPR) repeat protein